MIIQKACSLVVGQCTNLLESKLKQQSTWSTTLQEQNYVALISPIETITFRFEDQNKFLPLALCQSKANLCDLRQGNMINHEHLQHFQNLVHAAAACDGQSHDQAIFNSATKRFQAGAACNDLAAEEKKTVQTF
jgi:hypothetical protein